MKGLSTFFFFVAIDFNQFVASNLQLQSLVLWQYVSKLKKKKNPPQPSRFKLYTTLPICTCDLQKPQRSQHVS